MEARRSAGLSTAPPCLWAPTPPLELKGAPAHALDANSGFVSFGTLSAPFSEHYRTFGIVIYCTTPMEDSPALDGIALLS